MQSLYILDTLFDRDDFIHLTSEVMHVSEDGVRSAIEKSTILSQDKCIAFVHGVRFGDLVSTIQNPLVISSRLEDCFRSVNLPPDTEMSDVELFDDDTEKHFGFARCVHFKKSIDVFSQEHLKFYLSRSSLDNYRRLNLPRADRSIIPEFDVFRSMQLTICTDRFRAIAIAKKLTNLHFTELPFA